jgi:hypothetical protein
VPTLTLIPQRLELTLPQARARMMAELGVVGIPNAHWPLSTGNDCLAFVLYGLGVRRRDQGFAPGENPLISISAFRASAGWHEVGPAEVRAGDLALWGWDGHEPADHIEFTYSRDLAAGEITTVSANTGPRPGVDIEREHPELRGIYRKTRAVSSSLLGGIRPPYAQPVPTSSDLANVRAAATYLNRVMPPTFHDEVTGRTLTLHRSGAGDGSGNGKRGDGKRGPFYRLMVQCWGRQHALYGRSFRLDSVFGPQSERVEDHLFAVAKAAKR